MRLISVAFVLWVFSSCQPRRQTINESQRDAMVDSIVGTRMEEIVRQASEDMDRRRAIEVKAKADSIIAVRINGPKAPADNTIPNNLPMP